MARTAQIHYKRVTFSFPAKVAERLKAEVGNDNMSRYVAALVEQNLDYGKKEEDTDELFNDIKKLAKKISKNKFDKRSSLEILREIRYGEK